MIVFLLEKELILIMELSRIIRRISLNLIELIVRLILILKLINLIAVVTAIKDLKPLNG